MLNWIVQNLGGPTPLIFIGAIISAAGAVWAQIESNRQSQQVLELNQKITNTVTGGNSYPNIGPVFVARHGEQGDIRYLHLAHSGQYPLYDLVVIVTDLEKMDQLQKKGAPFKMDEYMWRFHIGTIGKGFEQKLMEVPNPNAQTMRFNIISFARNGQFNQRSIFTKVNGEWVTGTRLVKEGEIVVEQISQKFPKELMPLLTQDGV